MAPLTSTPTIGTIAKKIKEIKKIGKISFNNASEFIIETKNIIIIANEAKKRCFTKKNRGRSPTV